MGERVFGHSNLVREGSGITNDNDSEYKSALMRIKKNREFDEMKQRIVILETKLNTIIELLQTGVRTRWQD